MVYRCLIASMQVRRCAQDYLEKALTSFNCSAVVKDASKLIMSLLKNHMPLAIELSSLRPVDGSKDETSSEPEHLEVLYVLNVVKISVPYLSAKITSKVMSEMRTLLRSDFSLLTRHVLKIIEAFFETSRVEVGVSKMGNIVDSLASYVSLGDGNPLDTVISAATLLKRALDALHNSEPSSWIRSLPLVCESLAGRLFSKPSRNYNLKFNVAK